MQVLDVAVLIWNRSLVAFMAYPPAGTEFSPSKGQPRKEEMTQQELVSGSSCSAANSNGLKGLSFLHY